MGNNNALILTPRARTLFATEENYDGNKNPGKRVNKFDYTIQGQRWHFTITLPSTAVAVKAGKQPTTSNIEEICNDKHVILTSLDLKAMGEHYTLKTDVKNTEISIQTIKPTGEVSEKTYDISSIPNQVVTVTSSNKTSRDDLAVSGTH
ncbi:hypothetical protein AB2T63_07685 [Clostridium butyricum]|uniref:hypothetical protein n=1 Tax=Clostridium butyricum TaxID=1492 RepID=UPI0034665494